MNGFTVCVRSLHEYLEHLAINVKKIRIIKKLGHTLKNIVYFINGYFY